MPRILVSDIVPDPLNVRVAAATKAQDDDLAASVDQQGVLQPILVRRHPGETPAALYMVVCGHRRLQAARSAGLLEIPAEVRAFGSEAEVRLAQLAENTRRADMNPVDVWAAVEAAAAAGLSDDAIALAMNRPRREVERFRAMGRLHPDLQDHVRANPNEMPDARQLRVISQAPRHKQADAFHASVARNLYGHSLWHATAHILDVKRFPLKHARFDRKLYTGPVFRDLFSEQEDNEEAEDAEQFLRLQTEWMQDRCGDMLKKGFRDAVVLEREQYGGFKAPAAARKHSWGEKLPERLPNKAARKELVYAAGLEHSGEVVERLFHAAPEKTERERAEAPALGVAPKRRPDGRDAEAAFFTNDGLKELEKHKRRALGEALGDGTPFARDLDVVAAVLAVLLREKAGGYAFGHGSGPSLLPLLDDDGRLSIDGKVDELVAFGRALARHALASSSTSLPVAELVGDFLRVPARYPSDGHALSHLKRQGIEGALRAMGQSNHPTLKAGRAAIEKGAPAGIGPEHVPAIAWQVKPKPAASASGDGAESEGTESAAALARVFGEALDEYPEPDTLSDDELSCLLELTDDELADYGTRGELLEEEAKRKAKAASLERDASGSDLEHMRAIAEAAEDDGAPIEDLAEIGPEHADMDLREAAGRPSPTEEAAFKAWEL